MNNSEYKKIKKKYGENTAKLCRRIFPTLFEHEGLVFDLLFKYFEPNHSLGEDLEKYDMITVFKNFIFDKSGLDKSQIYVDTGKTPTELLEEAGYDLYECKTEEEIQYFKKYYASNESLCTFRGGRLDDCYVFFAVKKDVDNIRRDDFLKPQRQDEYGTSVISIQFTKDGYCTLSIKNRYNHTVENPDSTFSNDLENIIPGLTKAFENYYGMIQKIDYENLSIPFYKQIDDKFYKFNSRISDCYYGANNLLIKNDKVTKFPPEQYILMDYFLLDLKTGKISLYDKRIPDYFLNSMSSVNGVKVEKIQGGDRVLHFSTDSGGNIDITIDKSNSIIGVVNNEIEEVGDYFLAGCQNIRYIEMKNVKHVKNHFAYRSDALEAINMPNVESFGNYCLHNNLGIQEMIFPKLKKVGDYFSDLNCKMDKFVAPNLIENGKEFLSNVFKYRYLQYFEISDLNRDPKCIKQIDILKYIHNEKNDNIGKGDRRK